MGQRQIADLQPGQKYYLQVRAISKTDPNIKSPWSKSFGFTTTNDLVAPKPVSNLTFVSEGTSFIAKWDEPTQNANNTSLTDLKGYLITFTNVANPAQVSAEIFTPEKSYLLDFDRNKEMFGAAKGNLKISVKAMDQVGNLSTVVTATAQNPIPANVTGLVSEDMIEAINVKWDANPETDIHHYELYVSTASSSYTIGPATLRYSGMNTSFLVTSGNPTPHYVKVVAVDIFGQQSAVPALTTNTPRTTTSTDGTPPVGPTGVVASSVTDGVRADLSLNWTASVSTDVDHYEIRYSTDTTNWSYISAPNDVTSARIRGLKSGTQYYVGIKAVDYAANSSSFVNASAYPYTTVADTVAPNKPAPLTVATSVLKAQITHSMLDSTAVNLAADTDYLEIYADTTAGFTPVPGNQVTKIKTAGVGVAVSELVTYPTATNLYWKVIAVDVSGNKSVSSDATLGTPSLIQTAFIQDAAITDAKIGSLSATKLVAGTAFINDLLIRSKLTIDSANGSIESDDFNATNRTGWKINRDGITIYEGAVKASALEIQDSQNLVPAAFADFEFNNEFYYTSTNAPNLINLNTATSIKLAKALTNNKYGTQHMRVYDTVGALNNYVNLGNAGNFNIALDGGNTYIASIWVKNNLASVKNFTFAMVTDAGETFAQTFSIPASSGWSRKTIVCATNLTSTKGVIILGDAANETFDFGIDGLQVERKIGSLDTPSPWTPPGLTTINGESIVTGSIKSSAPAASIPDQPAWSLNTAGNAQFGDALVRGSLTVGAGADLANSVVKSASYAAGTTGWIIKGDGSVEFNNGVFRGSLNVERMVSGLTTNLKADIGQQKIYTSGGPTSDLTINTPIISGQHYGYDRSLTTGAWYLPTVPNPAKKMKYFFGPTTEKSVILQMNDNDLDNSVVGALSTYPFNTQIVGFKFGELINYKDEPRPRENIGWKLEASNIESPSGQYIYTRTSEPGGTYTPSANALSQNYAYQISETRIRSPYKPEYETNITNNTMFYSRSEHELTSRTSHNVFNKNLLLPPYDETWHPNFPNDTATYSDVKGTGVNQVATTGGTAIGVTASAVGIMYDNNYKTPSYLVNYSVGSATSVSLFFSPNATPGTQNFVHSIRRGKTYILSIFIKTNLPGSSTSGVQGPPIAPFNLTLGLRCQTTGTSSNDHAAAVTVQPGLDGHRVSVAITIPAGSPEYDKANLYLVFPATSPLNRQVAISHPMVEEKVWQNDPNPLIAASNKPTSWTYGSFAIRSENYAKINVVANSNSDMRYDAYGRNARGNQLFSNLNYYKVSDYGVYREAPAYIDFTFDRISTTSTAYAGDTATSKFRFSEAGLQFPGSFEPYNPAGVQATFSNRNLPKNGSINLFEHAYSVEQIFMGNGVRRFNDTTSFIVDRGGFYMMYATMGITDSNDEALWFNWRVTNTTGTFDIARSAVGRHHVWEADSSCLRYLNRDDIVTLFVTSGPNNALPTNGHTISNLICSIVRLN